MNQIIKVLILISLSATSFAHSSGGHTSDEFGIPDSGSSMFHMPIQIGFDGNINFGYKMNMDHGTSSNMSHDGMDHTDMGHMDDMGHGNMDHGNMSDMNNDMGMGDSNHMNDGDMNHNDMDHGDMDMADSDADSSTDHSGHSSSSSVHWHLMPMVSLGIDKINRKIKLDDESIKIIRARKIEVGAGLMVMGHLMNLPWSTMVTAGLMPYKGEYKYMEKLATHNDSDDTFLKVPSTIDDLNKWSIGDKLSYSSHGGVMSHGGITFGHILDISANYMFQGKWRISIEKVSETKIKTTFLNEEMSHYSSSIGNMGLSLSSGKMNMEGKSETFTFDLTDQGGVSTYISALSGDLTKAQELESLEGGPVFRNSFGTSSMIAFQRMTALQIPALFVRSKSNSKMYSLSNSTDNFFGMETKTDMAMTVDSKSTSGLFSKHKSRNEYFMAMAMNVKQNGKNHVNYASSWKRLFERDKVSRKQYKKELKYLNQKTGFDLSELEIPSSSKYGYFRSEFEINLTQGATDKIISLIDNSDRRSLLQKTYDTVNAGFRADSKKMKKLCKKRFFKSCHKALIKSSSTLIVEMWDQLKIMKKAKHNNNWKKFTAAYNKFGSFMMENQFVFKAILSNLSKEDYKVSLRTLGEKQVEKLISL